MLFNQIKKHSDSTALLTRHSVVSYRQYLNLIHGTASNLTALNIKKGERIAIISGNSPEFVVLLPALLRRGAVAVAVNPRFPVSQIKKLLENINCSIMIGASKLIEKRGLEKFARYQIEKIAAGNLIAVEYPAENIVTTTDRDATIVFTSGSSAGPKAVLHTIGNHYYSALGSNLNIPFGKGDVWLLSLPLFHVGGMAIVFRAIVGGGAVALPQRDETLAEALLKYRPTHISLVATQLYRLLQDEQAVEQLSRMKAVLLGGSAIPENLIKKAMEMGISLFTSYGSTEMASQITTTGPGDSLKYLLTAGKILKYREVKIAEDGEILVKGNTLCRGYIEGGRLEEIRNVDGWFATRDLGEFTDKGYLTITGRKDNMFISGGENIQPEEIEKALYKMENVVQALVVPVINAEYGERPVAFVHTGTGHFPDEVVFRKFLMKHIAVFKIPDRFFPWPIKNKRTGIKPDRNYLRRMAGERMNL
ncbi:MAG: o-succinylbenzoate--CoA ligase [Calditrichia bacterium]